MESVEKHTVFPQNPTNEVKSTERRQKLMLAGEYRHNLDAKNRLFIPAKHREALGEVFMVAKSFRDACLKVYSMEEWNAFITPMRSMTGKEKDKIFRALHRDSAEVTPDAQGRIVIPAALVAHAGIEKGAVVVGCGDYAEIWSDANYEAMVNDEDLDGIRDLLESYGL